jgi:hypothetical protein
MSSRARAKHLERVAKTLLQCPNDEQCVTTTDIIAMAGGEAKGTLFELMRGDRGGPSKAIGRAIAQMIPAPMLKKVRGGRGKETIWAPVTYVSPATAAAAGAGEARSEAKGNGAGRCEVVPQPQPQLPPQQSLPQSSHGAFVDAHEAGRTQQQRKNVKEHDGKERKRTAKNGKERQRTAKNGKKTAHGGAELQRTAKNGKERHMRT